MALYKLYFLPVDVIRWQTSTKASVLFLSPSEAAPNYHETVSKELHCGPQR